MSDWYILNEDHTVTKAVTEEEKFLAYEILGSRRKIVAQTDVGNKHVSTVFLGLDHSYSPPPCLPVLFETMVFVDGDGGDTHRYYTWQEAEAGHWNVVKNLTSGFTREELEQAKAVIEPLLK